MPPKADPKGKGKGDVASATPLLEALFPAWADAGASIDKEPTDKYEDIAGLALPPETQQYLDTWKRPEELVQNMPNLPIVVIKPADAPVDDKAAKGGKGAPPPVSREFEGKLFAGHKTFEWLQGVFNAVTSIQKTSPPGSYLWELIHPRDPKDNTHIKPPSGKYRVKLFIMDTWRTVVVDDRIPVDLFGRPLLVGVIPIALWPLLLSKAVIKVMAALRVTGLALPHQVAAFSMLTGWPHEDLLDQLSGAQLTGGFLFDRLEDSVKGNEQRAERRAIATVCLKDRAMPPKPPPRIIVLTGPCAVGRAALMQRLVNEFPDRFGLTVSHTSRPPREHEVHGQDYMFVSKSELKSLQQAGDLLEYTPVSRVRAKTHGQAGKPKDAWYMYGTSISTVREVAATGKLCVMGIEQQGVEALRANKRIDGLYIYCAPPSLEELEHRIRGRLKEAASTVEKRLTWAVEQTEQASKPGLFDHVVSNDEFDEVYHSLKEAISTLSPIIRNRLRGLPAYVLDYSDLIPPNSVEKPFLKPVLVSGPTAGERTRLMEQLVTEFPDVFAFPRITTTRPSDQELQHVLTPEELEQVREERQASLLAAAGRLAGSRSASPSMKVRSGPAAGLAPEDDQEEEEEEEEQVEEAPTCTYPEPIHVSEADFDAAAASGQLLEQHTELFKHKMASHKVGVSADAIREVIKSGKLPLLELEVDGVSSFKQRGIDCLTIFLQPLSHEEFKTRLVKSLTETDEEVAARLSLSEAQMTAASSSSLFDYTLVNDQMEDAYQEMKSLISQLRPDIIPPVDEAAEAAANAVSKHPVLVLTGPNSAGRSALAAQLAQSFPNTFAIPGQITDRKPAKGQQSTDELTFVSGKELAKMVAENQLLVQWPGEGGSMAITLEALQAITSANKVAVIELPEAATNAALPVLKASPVASGALYVFVASAALNAAATPPMPDAALLSAVDEATASGLYSLVCSEGNEEDLKAAVRGALCSHVPDIVRPPYKPLVIAAPFGTGARQLLQELFFELPGAFASPMITTTKPSAHPEVDERLEMNVVSAEQASALVASGAFLFHTTALGHTYGVQLADVRRIQASGKVCVIEVDTVATVDKLKASGFEATYVFVGVPSMDELLKRVHAAVVNNPPLGYEPDEAAAMFFATAKAEMSASKAEGLFDAWVDNTADSDASFSRLAETVHKAYPDVVVPQFVYGYGRGLWDPAVRSYGQHPLKVMVLGPAGCGKSTQCEMLAQQFDLPHINVGDLLYEEIKAGTPLGLEAKQWADASKTVPDRLFLQMLTKRLAEPDCTAKGWLLDGFPHTAHQAAELKSRGLEPDKVVFLHAENSILMDRTRYRRVDMDTGAIYHMAEPGALSPAIKPLTPTGELDTSVLQRLHPRHDDSEENVEARLTLWDQHVRALREVYEDVSLRVPAAGRLPAEICEQLGGFLSLEAQITDIQVINSASLKELQYEVVDTLRYRRSQLVRLIQFDGKTFWVDSKELAYNSHCMLLARDPTSFPITQQLSRLDLTAVARTALVWVNSPEPSEVLVTLALGPQAPFEDNPDVPPRVLLVSGPVGAGKASLTGHLVDDYPDKLALVQPWTTRPPHKGEQDGNPMFFTDLKSMQVMQSKGQLAGHVIAEHDGHQYAVRSDALQQAWSDGKLPVVVGPHALAVSLKEAAVKLAEEAGVSLAAWQTSSPASAAGAASKAKPPLVVHSLYITADVESIDVRLRQEWQLEEQQLQQELSLAVQEEHTVKQAEDAFRQQVEAAQAAYVSAQAAATQAASVATTGKGGDAGAAAAQQALASAATAVAAASLPPPDTPDCLIANTERGALMVYQTLKEAVSKLWHKPRNAVACQVLLESFDWMSASPGSTQQRLRTVTLSGGTLELPRGQHLLKVTAASDYPHAITLYSVPPCKPDTFFCRADELSVVMKEMCDTLQGKEGNAKAVVTTLTGQCELPGPDKTLAVLRYILQVSEPTQITGSLSIPKEQLRAITRMSLVDNTTGVEVSCLSGRLPLTQLEPSPAGYTLLAVASAPGTSPASEEPAVPWVVQLLSSGPLSACQETSVARTQVLQGAYTPNSRCILARYVLTPIQAVQLALHASTQPALPFKVSICTAPTGGELVWGTAYPELLQHVSQEGEPMVVSKPLEPGKYLVMVELDRDACPAGWQPDPVTGAIHGGGAEAGSQQAGSKPVSWRLTFMPSVDDKVCPITLDDSQARSFKAMQDTWNAAGVAAPGAAGGKPGAPPAKPPAGKPGAGLSGRAAAAAALLDKVVSDLGGSPAGTAPAAASPVKRALKDGSSVELAPDAHLRLTPATAEAHVVGEQHLLDQAASIEEALTQVPPVSGQVVGVLAAGKEVCAGTKTKRLEEFGAWRRDAVTAQQELLQKRAAALLMAKNKSAPSDVADADKLPAVRAQ